MSNDVMNPKRFSEIQIYLCDLWMYVYIYSDLKSYDKIELTNFVGNK